MGKTINLTQDEVNQAKGIFKPRPEGIYGAVIYSAKEAVAKSSGNDMFVIEYKTTEGQGKPGRKLTAYYSHSKPAWFKLRELLKATGFTINDKAGEQELPDPEEFLGIAVNLAVTIEDYDSVDDDGNDIVRQRNTVNKVHVYDEDKIDTEAPSEDDAPSENFLGL